MLDKVRRNTAKAEELRKVLKSIYSKQEYADKINDLADEQVLELCDNLRRGVPMATPVFDGAHEPDIVEMLEKAGLDKSRSEERRVGKECVSTCRSRWSRSH